MTFDHDPTFNLISMVQLPVSLWKSALDGASDEIYLVDQHGFIHYANNAAVASTGLNEAQLVGRPIANLETNATPIDWTSLWADLVRVGFVRLEVQRQDVEGNDYLAEWRITLVRHEIGMFALIMASSLLKRPNVETADNRKTMVANAINQVLQDTINPQTDNEIGELWLKMAEDMTGSKYGFVGEINEEGKYDALALSDPGWDACRIPGTNKTKLIMNMVFRGFWGHPVTTGESIIVNEPDQHPQSVGRPEGHPPLTAFLGVPMKHNGKVVGMFALANKEGGYDEEDVKCVELLAMSFVEALLRRRMMVREKDLHEARDASLKDPLTGLYNRRFFDEFQRNLGFEKKTAVLACDVDHFKATNDTYGHAVGDTVLKEVAAIMMKCVRESDYVIRIGGEEFVILIQESSDDVALITAERIRRMLARYVFCAASDEFNKTISIGIAMFPEDADSLSGCLELADKALYQAKEEGRDRVVRYVA
ncbi:sensor domain-containing diguanylate cyclase [Candidatus Methylobacter oryzae]|uniref:diguanylate cyclase n=1 Tax=Candidatus Methylobacter oryzae TaxID=2497749 RepID=A0ABY3CE66_9GAMM|nr:sensor domain-containing diguanylate cyclase [Candidatus Methylobacter oryzae]TRX01161.1 sensor domain-containing diguanylate cyclase [Candidatus Methylobacter oryzae]